MRLRLSGAKGFSGQSRAGRLTFWLSPMAAKRFLLASVFAPSSRVCFSARLRASPGWCTRWRRGACFRDAEPEKRIIANTGRIVFRDYVLVIDANFPWGARAALDDIRKTTNKPIRFVFDTHYRAMDRMLAVDVAIVIPGHGVQGTREALRGQQGYLADLISKVRRGISGRTSARGRRGEREGRRPSGSRPRAASARCRARSPGSPAPARRAPRAESGWGS